MITIYCPNQNSIFETAEMTISESKLYIFLALPNQNSIFVRIKTLYLVFLTLNLWKTSVEKNEFFHNFRIRTLYISTTSESELYIFPQHPNDNSIFLKVEKNTIFSLFSVSKILIIFLIIFLPECNFQMITTYLSFDIFGELFDFALFDVGSNCLVGKV